MAASVAPEGYKRERDGDGDSSGLPKKLRTEDTASLIGGAGKDNDVTVSEPKDEDMNGGGGDGTKIGSVEEGGGEEIARGDALVSEEKKEVLEAKVGPKVFTSSLDMLNYFHEFVRTWPLNYNVNKVNTFKPFSYSFVPSSFFSLSSGVFIVKISDCLQLSM